MDRDKREQLVKQDLEQLKQQQYISQELYFQIIEAHRRYYADLDSKEAEWLVNSDAKHTQEVEQQNPFAPDEKEIPAKGQGLTGQQPKKKTIPAKDSGITVSEEDGLTAPQTSASSSSKGPGLTAPKRKLSPQEIRERNITWLLNLGVIMLLIGGLILATSKWETLDNWMKSGLIVLVSIMFFGLAVLTMYGLKIRKTAFAFYVLGGLFLPISILSIGFFELLGPYFSLHGEGRYWFGASGSLMMLPIYLLLAERLMSRLFVWLSYVTLTLVGGFLLAALQLPVDGFYLGMMVFNGLLIVLYRTLRAQKWLQLFMKEFLLYLQGNLVLSTFLMLMFYHQELAYSFNLILTAILYFAMIYVTNHKEYHFVFSVLLVYGAYQLIEFSVLQEVDATAYALLGLVFLGIPLIAKNDQTLKIALRYTSAIVSACAFFYISVNAALQGLDEPSVNMLIAYIVIAVNFLVLANWLPQKLFAYLSPVFLMASLYEVALYAEEGFGYENLSLSMFVMGFLLYGLVGCLQKPSFFRVIRESARDVGAIVMFVCMMDGFIWADWWQTGIKLLVISALALVMERVEKRTVLIEHHIAVWVHVLALGFAVTLIYAAVRPLPILAYYFGSAEAGGFILAGITVLLASYLWRYVKWQLYDTYAFYSAHGFYFMGMLLTLDVPFAAINRTLIMLGGVAMAYLLYRRLQRFEAAYAVSGMAIAFYLSVLYAINKQMMIHSDVFEATQFVIGAAFLLWTGYLLRQKDVPLSNAFYVSGHGYLLVSLLGSFIVYEEYAAWTFFIAAALYGLSIFGTRINWIRIGCLYACFTSFWAGLLLLLVWQNAGDYLHYGMLATSILIAVGWYFSKGRWTEWFSFYLIPFSVIGIAMFTLTPNYDGLLFLVTALYAAGTIALMHQRKWEFFHFIPLLLVYYALWLFDGVLLTDHVMLFRLGLFAVLLTSLWMRIFSVMYEEKPDGEIPYMVDWYSILGFTALCNMYAVTEPELWTKLLPGVLIVLYLMVQRKRIPFVSSKWIVFVACVYLLQPYYALLGSIEIPALIEREVYVLPWVVVAIFLKKISRPESKQMVNYVQWSVLVIVALLLVQDAMASSTIYDALIIGVLSLASLLGGMAYQLKSFFFIGAGVLLLNVFLQTRPFWGNLPWWAYLLIAGSILIIVASYNEWHKQKTSAGKSTMITLFYQKVVQMIKRWE